METNSGKLTYSAVGRRKEASAQVTITPGKGDVMVNGRGLKDYFKRDNLLMLIKQPLEATGLVGKYDIVANVKGGGLAGQAGALRHGISRAIEQVDPKIRPIIKKEGMLTRDPRMRERKKYGQKGARKRFQFSKR